MLLCHVAKMYAIIILILHLSVCESGRSREAIRPEVKRFPSLDRWTWTLYEAAH